MTIRSFRAEALTVRGHTALTVAVAAGLFLGAALCGSTGAWTSTLTWLTVAVATGSGAAMACYWLAARVTHRGDSPEVTHPGPGPGLTPVEVRK